MCTGYGRGGDCGDTMEKDGVAVIAQRQQNSAYGLLPCGICQWGSGSIDGESLTLGRRVVSLQSVPDCFPGKQSPTKVIGDLVRCQLVSRMFTVRTLLRRLALVLRVQCTSSCNLRLPVVLAAFMIQACLLLPPLPAATYLPMVCTSRSAYPELVNSKAVDVTQATNPP